MPGKRKKKSAAALDPNPVKNEKQRNRRAKRKLPAMLPLRRNMCPPRLPKTAVRRRAALQLHLPRFRNAQYARGRRPCEERQVSFFVVCVKRITAWLQADPTQWNLP